MKPPIHMQEVTTSRNKILVASASDKNCLAKICYKKQKKSEYNDLKVNPQCILTSTVKKIKISICSQWSPKWICGYPNQYYTSTEDCILTRTVKLQDATGCLNSFSMAGTVNLPVICVMKRKSEFKGTYFLYVVSTKTNCK